jgi:hypothetical protein
MDSRNTLLPFHDSWKARLAVTRPTTSRVGSEGGKLTGTMSNERGSIEITDRTIDGSAVEFKVKREFNGNSLIMTYKGALNGDDLKLTVTVEGRDRPGREMTAKRVK